MSYCLYYIFASFTSEVPWAKCSDSWGMNGDISADDRCYTRDGLTNCSYGLESGKCQTAAKQYFDKVVLGVDKALLAIAEVYHNETTNINQTFALSEPGNIGMIKWDITLCLLLSWTIVCLCLIKGKNLINIIIKILQSKNIS